MNRGEIKSFIAVVTVIALGTLLSSAAFAAPSCSSFLIKTDDEAANQNPLEVIQNEINAANTLDEANKLTYELVALGNNIFDQAIDGIIAINTRSASDPEVAKQQAEQVQFLIDALQNAFKIPSYVMGFAISNRLEVESAEAQKILRADRRREVIGFVRTQLAKDVNDEMVLRQPIGFALKSAKKEKNSFFKILIEQLNANALAAKKAANENKVESSPSAFRNRGVSAEKTPIGFVPPKENTAVEDTAPLEQIGFIQPEETSKSFKESDVNQIVLNVQVGEFRIVEDSVKQPAGF